jgi:hypothetical protein
MNYKALALGAVLGLAAALTPACGGTDGNGLPDAGGTPDAGAPDSGTPDAGPSQCVTSTGCCTAAGAPLPGTSDSNCGTGGGVCSACPTGQTCEDLPGGGGECKAPPPPPDAGPTGVMGNPCTADADCGAGFTCKLTTSMGNATYPGGYCTRLCGQDGACPADSLCVGPPGGGETDALCWANCAAPTDCREGYTCYTLTDPDGVEVGSGCFLDPIPEFTTNVGGACEANADCNLLDGECIPATEADAPTGFTDGYCSAACQTNPAKCGDNGVCLGTATAASCFAGCTTPGQGQGPDCRDGYVCRQIGGGTATEGFCFPNCNNPGAPACGTGTTCQANGYCA